MKFIKIESNRKSPIACNFNHVDSIYDKIELEITLDCNLRCSNCNRMAGVFDFGDTNMTIKQIEHFVFEVSRANWISDVYVMGGEPLIHPRFLDIWSLLYRNLRAKLHLVTNGTLPIPEELNSCKYELLSKPPEKKRHEDFYVAPCDVELLVGLCPLPKCCGIALNKFGYFPCGPGGSLYRLLNLDIAKYKLPKSLAAWNYSDFCLYCTHANKEKKYSDVHSVPKCSSTFMSKVENFNKKSFPLYPEGTTRIYM